MNNIKKLIILSIGILISLGVNINSGFASSGTTLVSSYSEVEISYKHFSASGSVLYSTGGVITGTGVAKVKALEVSLDNRLFMLIDTSREELINKKLNLYKKELDKDLTDEKRDSVYKALQDLYAKKMLEAEKIVTVVIGLKDGTYVEYKVQKGEDNRKVNFKLPAREKIVYIKVNNKKMKVK